MLRIHVVWHVTQIHVVWHVTQIHVVWHVTQIHVVWHVTQNRWINVSRAAQPFSSSFETVHTHPWTRRHIAEDLNPQNEKILVTLYLLTP
jgi:hypothetical protein